MESKEVTKSTKQFVKRPMKCSGNHRHILLVEVWHPHLCDESKPSYFSVEQWLELHSRTREAVGEEAEEMWKRIGIPDVENGYYYRNPRIICGSSSEIG